MEGSRSEISAADESEEVTYTSVKFSQTPPPRVQAAQEKRESCCLCGYCTEIDKQANQTPLELICDTPHPWSAAVLGLAIGFGTLSISLVIALIWKMSDCHPHCPQQWVAYRGSCYSFSTVKKDWNSSQESCRAEGAHLLVISDTWEMDLFKSIKAECFWIGLRNSTNSGWIWEGGSVLNNTKVLSNSPVQNCAVLMKHEFRASSCEVPAPWICEKSLR